MEVKLRIVRSQIETPKSGVYSILFRALNIPGIDQRELRELLLKGLSFATNFKF